MESAELDLGLLLDQLEKALETAETEEQLWQAIVEAPFEHNVPMALLFLGFISFCLVDEKEQMIKSTAVTDNDYYHRSIENYDFDPSQYRVPLGNEDNSMAEALRTGKPVTTVNWDSLSRPDVKEGVARLNQASSGIGFSVVYPLPGKIRGVLLYCFFEDDGIIEQQREFMGKYAALVASRFDATSNLRTA